MTKEELAARLNGREYLHEMMRIDESDAKASGLVVIFGESDDLMELRGAINDESSCFGGGWATGITSKGILANECDDEDCPYFAALMDACKDKITALWYKEGYSWVYETDMPHASFDIMDDGRKYCRGIVVELPKP